MSYFKKGVILTATAILLIVVVTKVFLLQSDIFDKLTSIFAITLFFFDQITR